MSLKLYEYFIKTLSIFIVFYFIIFGLDTKCYVLSSFFILSCNFYQLLKAKSNIFLLIIVFFISYCNYSVIYVNFINPLDSYYVRTLAGAVVYKSINILALFNIFILWFVKWNKICKDTFLHLKKTTVSSKLLLLGIIVVLLYILLFCFSRPTEIGERGSPSSVYEYSICLFIAYFYFCGRSKIFINLGKVLIVVFSLQNFIFGGRILGLQFLVALYLIEYKDSISKKVLYTISILMFLLMSMIGVLRGNILSGNFDIESLITGMIQNGFALDTSYSAFFTSETYIYTKDIIPDSERFYQFLFFIKSIFLGYGDRIDLFPSYITTNYVANYGGSFIPHFFYYYIGTPGIILGALLVSFYLNIIRKFCLYSSPYIKCVIILVVCTVFRWYLYTPMPLLRSVLFINLIILLCNIYNNITIRKFSKI